MTTFGELFELIRNGRNVKQVREGEGLRVSRIETISRGVVDLTRTGRTADSVPAGYFVREGDLLFSHINSPENVGRVAFFDLDDGQLVHGINLLLLRCRRDRADPRYMFHLIRSPRFRAALMPFVNRAVNQASVSISNLKSITVEVPRVHEQRRIAALLDQADELRARRESSLNVIDSLSESIFLDMFGDPVTNPRRWTVAPFSEVCPTRLGQMVDQKQQTGEHRRPYLRNANVRWFDFDLTDVAEMDFGPASRAEFRVQPGDLLICEGGEPGRAAIWDGRIEEIYFQKALHRGRPDPARANATYLAHLLRHLARRGGLVDHISSATIAHLTGVRLKSMMVPVPQLHVQDHFEAHLAEINRLRVSCRRSGNDLDGLFSCLQHQAFAGQL